MKSWLISFLIRKIQIKTTKIYCFRTLDYLRSSPSTIIKKPKQNKSPRQIKNAGKNWLDKVAHTCNPCYLGGDWKDCGLRPAGEKS
jgi:hypothetical protein